MKSLWHRYLRIYPLILIVTILSIATTHAADAPHPSDDLSALEAPAIPNQTQVVVFITWTKSDYTPVSVEVGGVTPDIKSCATLTVSDVSPHVDDWKAQKAAGLVPHLACGLPMPDEDFNLAAIFGRDNLEHYRWREMQKPGTEPWPDDEGEPEAHPHHSPDKPSVDTKPNKPQQDQGL